MVLNSWITRLLIGCICTCMLARDAGAQSWQQPPPVLPGSQPLTWTGPLDVRLMDGARRYIEREVQQSPAGRARHWQRDLSSLEAYERSVAGNRERLRAIIGAVNRGKETKHNGGPRRLGRLGIRQNAMAV